ncbi:unnamed protein product [Cuscuta epithymum]|uniref:Uncharacterized protein n=1 Tax=Cuscuta epithymum TaxID=186058 RepID=A0AAV0C254_9ASTE|nr:unnamed protein product [Cuscuta epithymum]
MSIINAKTVKIDFPSPEKKKTTSNTHKKTKRKPQLVEVNYFLADPSMCPESDRSSPSKEFIHQGIYSPKASWKYEGAGQDQAIYHLWSKHSNIYARVGFHGVWAVTHFLGVLCALMELTAGLRLAAGRGI